MKLYHGSTVTVKSPNIQKGRKATDFGKGFYTTTNFEQAKKWAILKKKYGNNGKKSGTFQFMKSPIIFLIESFQSFDLYGAYKRVGWSL